MNTKLIAALVIVGVLAVAVVGLVAAQVATSSPTELRQTEPRAVDSSAGWADASDSEVHNTMELERPSIKVCLRT